MGRRILQSIAVAGLLVVLIVILRLVPAPVAGQGQAPPPGETAGQAGPAPKTPWGAPDLQGIWTNTYEVPLQRPAKFANQEFFTDAEREELDKQRTAILSQDVRRY